MKTQKIVQVKIMSNADQKRRMPNALYIRLKHILCIVWINLKSKWSQRPQSSWHVLNSAATRNYFHFARFSRHFVDFLSSFAALCTFFHLLVCNFRTSTYYRACSTGEQPPSALTGENKIANGKKDTIFFVLLRLPSSYCNAASVSTTGIPATHVSSFRINDSVTKYLQLSTRASSLYGRHAPCALLSESSI